MLGAYKRQINYVVCISVSCYNGEITRKEMSNYFRVTTKDMVKCRLGLQAKIMDFDYREE